MYKKQSRMKSRRRAEGEQICDESRPESGRAGACVLRACRAMGASGTTTTIPQLCRQQAAIWAAADVVALADGHSGERDGGGSAAATAAGAAAVAAVVAAGGQSSRSVEVHAAMTDIEYKETSGDNSEEKHSSEKNREKTGENRGNRCTGGSTLVAKAGNRSKPEKCRQQQQQHW
jgi:subtilisin family serine protease